LKGRDFTGCEETHREQQEVSGHDFTGCEKTHREQQEVSGHDFAGCEKTHREQQEVSGRDFSRAESAPKSPPGFSPCYTRPGFDSQIKPFSAICLVPVGAVDFV
jgi:hypothetical protein